MSSSQARFRAAELGILFIVVLLWELGASQSNPIVLPSFVSVLAALWNLATLTTIRGIPYAFGVTIFEVLLGFSVSASLALAAGAILSVKTTVLRAYKPLLLFVLAVPHIIFFPLFIVLFGLGPLSKVAYGAFAGFPIMTLGILAAFSQSDKGAVAVAKSMGASSRQSFWLVVVPSSLSGVITSLRVGLGTVAIVVVVAEVIGSTNGLGFFLRTSYENFQIPTYYALAIVIALVVLMLNLGFSFIENRVRKWEHE